ncbi:MAG TPA: hypothetical protein VFV83_04605, partial [Chthoniobacteraceae bacterium]|nr:hypothetical protein [Chthoniobacteraceae bacterium]
MKFSLRLGVIIGLCHPGCVDDVRAQDADSSFPIRFRDVTEEAGLIAPLAGMMGHGGAIGDFDG